MKDADHLDRRTSSLEPLPSPRVDETLELSPAALVISVDPLALRPCK